MQQHTTKFLLLLLHGAPVLGAIAQFEKASAVAKLAAARKRKRQRDGRCEGRKLLSETRPEVAALARKIFEEKGEAVLRDLAETDKATFAQIGAGFVARISTWTRRIPSQSFRR
jgi:DNA invertase Pin-like site-specific DNA recombinase